MQTLVSITIVLVVCSLFVSCSKTVGSHTVDERQRLARLHSQLSFEFMLNNNLNVAQGEAEEALRLDPRGAEANHAMARVQQLLGNHQLVVQHYRQALRGDPYAVVVLNDYGQYLCQRGQTRKALNQFDQAGSQLMSSDRMVSYTRAAACSISNSDFNSAEEYLLKALQLNPDSGPVLLNLVRVTVKNDEYSRAKKYLEQYLKVEHKPSEQVLKLARQIENKI